MNQSFTLMTWFLKVFASYKKRAFTKYNVKFDRLTFISLQENSETVEIYFYSYHVIPSIKEYYFVN